jgi:AraC-like DNA-binding protein
VSDSSGAGQPCYSLRLVRPFSQLLRRYPGFPGELFDALDAMDPDERIPIVTVHELLRGGLEMTGDPDIGLKAAREIAIGDYGALEYVVSSAPTWGDALRSVGRYLPLVNDALQFSLRVEGPRAVIQLDSSVVLPRAAADFQSGAFHVAGLHRRQPQDVAEFEVLFTHPRPERVDEYERTFERGTLRFDAPFTGFAFDAAYLDMPVVSADPKLHDVLRKHAELMLAELPKAQSLTEQVRDHIAQQLSGGNPSVELIARQLHMSPRTLGRKLEHEGTTFKELLDDMRRRMALRYVGGHDLGLSEIAFLLGFSQTAAFHRAFKRWTGQTPLEYRRARRG